MRVYGQYEWYERFAKANEQNMGRDGVSAPTINECARYAQVEELHRIADALEELVELKRPITVHVGER